MKISDFGGEFKLIQSIAAKTHFNPIFMGIGDDCAVIPYPEGAGLENYQLIGSDMLIEGDHFSREYFSPQEIGIKTLESNVSDIAAMGGIAKYAVISISLPDHIAVEWVQKFYQGLYSRSNYHRVDIIGGDTTHGEKIALSMTVIGEVKKENICLRSQAKTGDLIYLTGEIGASTAGYFSFKNKIKGHKTAKHRHKNPRCQHGIIHHQSQWINAMADISDGLAADLGNILKASQKGAKIWKEKIPIAPECFPVAKELKMNAWDFAFHGGEDFELVFTIPKKNQNKVKGYCIGEITDGKGILMQDKKSQIDVPMRGFNHFGNL